MATISDKKQEPRYYTQIISELDSLKQNLFDGVDTENPKIKEDIKSKELLDTIKRIKLFMDVFKLQFVNQISMKEGLEKKLSMTPTFAADNETKASSCSSLNFAEIPYYEKILSDIKNLKKLLNTFLSSGKKFKEFSPELKEIINSIKIAVSLQFDFIEKMHMKLDGKSTCSPKFTSGMRGSQSDSALTRISKKEGLFIPEYVESLRDQNMELAKTLNEKRKDATEAAEKNRELFEENNILSEMLEKTISDNAGLKEKLRAYQFSEDK